MTASPDAQLAGVSTFRLHLLRGMYALLIVGLGLTIWPLIVSHPADVPHMNGVVRSLLGAVALLAVLGIRYPVEMIPLLLFELAWKVIWVLAFGAPLWLAGDLDAAHRSTLVDCLLGVALVPLVLPWGYVVQRYMRAPGTPWRRPAAVETASEAS